VRADSPIYASRGRPRRRARSSPLAAALVAGGALVVALVALAAYAGSSREFAEGTTIAGVDVGGLTRGQAVSKLESLFDEVAADSVAFTAGGVTFSYAANQLAVEPDWNGAVAAAGRAGSGFGPIRGLRRLRARFFGAEVFPRLAVSNGALEYALDGIAERVDREAKSAALVMRGLRVDVVPARAGSRLDRDAAAGVIVRTLGLLERPAGSTPLPVRVAEPAVSADALVPTARRARVVLSAPVYLRGANRSWRLPRWRLARLLDLPRDGASRLAIAGPGADAFFRSLAARVSRPPTDATFDVSGDRVQVVPSRDGTELNIPVTARALLRAALRPANRVATLTLARSAPEVTTQDALAMGIDTRMAGYKTYYSGTTDRITNLQLGVQALDGTLVPPGGTFSLNGAIGKRTVERGFRPAPVIVGNEYAEEVGGGTSQVATTVFNAAWEAGLRITERHPHSLYISRYQLGRDATVYWPSLDVKFVNDTKSWILVKGIAESDGIHVVLYGGERRRVESSAAPLVVTGRPPHELVKDPRLPKGKRVVEQEGSSPSRTSATREIYGPDDELIRSETWTTSYEGETRIVRVGTKEPKKPDEPTATPKVKPGTTDTGPAAGARPPAQSSSG
jgi:vancomycin resistance protein YoaR